MFRDLLISLCLLSFPGIVVPFTAPAGVTPDAARVQPASVFALAHADTVASGPAWIYWSDEQEKEGMRAAPLRPSLSARAVKRLERAGVDATLANPSNRPAPPAFLDHLSALGIQPRMTSRFLRAVNAELTREQWRVLERDPRVARVVPERILVRERAKKAPAEPGGGEIPLESADPASVYELPARPASGAADTLPAPKLLRRSDYGASWRQNDQLNVTLLHQLGYSGDGVLVAMLDGGFLTSHQAFARAHLIKTRDFVGQDSIVSFETANPQEPYNTISVNDHGTTTWSSLGGFKEGAVIGPAYRALFALGRTEIVQTEIRQEEGNYVAGLEWADSLGADVVSTSLGYVDFANGFRYFPEELDGKTAVTTQEAVVIARRGVILATAMGNENTLGSSGPNLITPADAESVVSVGAVDSLGRIATFSSRGPTADNRTKPDVCARGVQTACAVTAHGSTSTYGVSSGTSLATPLIGGLIALLKQAHPDWGPGEMLTALHRAGSRASNPDNIRGWGVPDGLRALGWVGPPVAGISGIDELMVERISWLDTGEEQTEATRDTLANPGNEGELTLVVRNDGAVSLPALWVTVAATNGQVSAAGDSVLVPALAPGERRTVSHGPHLQIPLAQPTPTVVRLALRFRHEGGGSLYRSADLPVSPQRWQIAPYPNPLTRGASLTVDLEMETAGEVRFTVFDVAGRQVASAFDGLLDSGRQRLEWTPPSSMATGVYFVRLQAQRQTRTSRFVLIR